MIFFSDTYIQSHNIILLAFLEDIQSIISNCNENTFFQIRRTIFRNVFIYTNIMFCLPECFSRLMLLLLCSICTPCFTYVLCMTSSVGKALYLSPFATGNTLFSKKILAFQKKNCFLDY